jgi:hypothetical protein
MVEVKYKMVVKVIDSWDRVKQTPKYEEVLGI